MGLIDSWIPHVAKKDFSETINWIDALVIFLLGSLLAGFIYLDMTPVDITIPAKVIDRHHVAIDQQYTHVIPEKVTQTLKGDGRTVTFRKAKKTYQPPHYVILSTTQTLPFEKQDKVRLVVFRKTILSMLLKTKSSGDE
jgi:hypothetical protein